MPPKPVTLASFDMADGHLIRLNRLTDGRLEVRRFDRIGPGNCPCPTRDGLTLPPELAADLAKALAAAAVW